MVHEINGQECRALLRENPDCKVLDVRGATEYAVFTLPNAFNIDILSTRAIDELEKLDRDETYLVYCAIGVRSKSATQLMNQMGFKNLYHLKEGILGYGFPTHNKSDLGLHLA